MERSNEVSSKDYTPLIICQRNLVIFSKQIDVRVSMEKLSMNCYYRGALILVSLAGHGIVINNQFHRQYTALYYSALR